MSRKGLLELLLSLLISIVVVLAVRTAVATPFVIPSASMEPTLHCARQVSGCEGRFSDRVLISRLSYRMHDPHRGDVAVFQSPTAAAAVCGAGGTYVKRIIGLPGETVTLKDGRVSIDGRSLSEPYAQRDHVSGSFSVPAGRYFFMGDNRADSCDSRIWGSVARSALLGPVILTYWPVDRIGHP